MVSPDNKIVPVTTRDSSVKSSDDKSRKPPSGDFEKVAKEVDERKSGGESNDGLEVKKDKKKPASIFETSEPEENPFISPFQLAGNNRDAADEKPKKKNDMEDIGSIGAVAQVQANVQPPSPQVAPLSSLFDKKRAEINEKVLDQSVQKTTISRDDAFNSIEQPDLAAVNPYQVLQQAPATPLIPVVQGVETAEVNIAAKPSTLQEDIDLIVQKIYTLKENGNTETVVSLKGGTFDGSRLIVTESKTAPGQLNITIDNLTAANQALLNTHKQELMNDLLAKGIQVQMFFASSTKETTQIDIATANEQQGQRNFQREGQDNPRDGRRQQSNG